MPCEDVEHPLHDAICGPPRAERLMPQLVENFPAWLRLQRMGTLAELLFLLAVELQRRGYPDTDTDMLVDVCTDLRTTGVRPWT